MKTIFRLPGILLGRIVYTPPPWMTAVNAFRKKKPAAFWAMVIVFLATALGAGVLMSVPGPVRVTAVISPPGPPADDEDPAPDRLRVEFDYVLTGLKPDQPVPEGTPSVARIDLIGKPVDGIRMTPALAGRWQWEDDRSLTFVPEKAWPAGTRFQVNFPAAIFSPETRLKKARNEFETPAFEASVEALEFYQDPTDSKVHRVVATLFFSHPVDSQSLEHRLSMAMRPSGEGVQTPPTLAGVTTTYDKHQRRAYVSSDPLTLPAEPNTMRLTVNKGVMPATGGNPTMAAQSDTVLIPDRFSFLKVSEANALIVANDRQEPEQVISLTFTDAIDAGMLSKKLSVYLLPAFNSKRKGRRWESPREVTDQELAASEQLTVKPVPGERPASTTHHFVIDAPENRYLYLHIDENLTSVNGFTHASFYDAVMATPAYPRQVQLAGEGSVLAYSGRKRLGIMARGLTALKISVGRLLPGQITHLVTQTGGDIRDPYFSNPNFTKADIAAFSRKILDLKPLHPGRANYTSLDLSGYLADEPQPVRPVFRQGRGLGQKAQPPVYGASDQRLILITDLGLLVKNNADGSHDVFVQSIRTGRPVPGATFTCWAKTACPCSSAPPRTTGACRHPRHPRFHRRTAAQRLPGENRHGHRLHSLCRPLPADRRLPFRRGRRRGTPGPERRTERLSLFRPGHLPSRRDSSPGDDRQKRPAGQRDRHPPGGGRPGATPQHGENREDHPAGKRLFRCGLHDRRHIQHRALPGLPLPGAGQPLPRPAAGLNRLHGGGIRARHHEDHQHPGRRTAPRLDHGKSLAARVELKNLFGAPARDRRVQARISVQPAHFRFEEFADYHFTDPFTDAGRKPLRLDEALEPAVTDTDGQGKLRYPAEPVSGRNLSAGFFCRRIRSRRWPQRVGHGIEP
jgi:hypothetical protein